LENVLNRKVNRHNKTSAESSPKKVLDVKIPNFSHGLKTRKQVSFQSNQEPENFEDSARDDTFISQAKE